MNNNFKLKLTILKILFGIYIFITMNLYADKINYSEILDEYKNNIAINNYSAAYSNLLEIENYVFDKSKGQLWLNNEIIKLCVNTYNYDTAIIYVDKVYKDMPDIPEKKQFEKYRNDLIITRDFQKNNHYPQAISLIENKKFRIDNPIRKLKTQKEVYKVTRPVAVAGVRGADEINSETLNEKAVKNDKFKIIRKSGNTKRPDFLLHLQNQNLKLKNEVYQVKTPANVTGVRGVDKIKIGNLNKKLNIQKTSFKVTEPMIVTGVRGADELKIEIGKEIDSLEVNLEYIEISDEEISEFKIYGGLSPFLKKNRKKGFFNKFLKWDETEIKTSEASVQILKNALVDGNKYLKFEETDNYPIQFLDNEFSNLEINMGRIYYLNIILQMLGKESKKSDFKFKCDIFYDRYPNAFTLPSGYMFISESFLSILDNEDELAAVLAHELAHITLSHNKKSEIKKGLLDGALDVVLEKENQTKQQIAKKVNNTFFSNAFDRGDEYAADKKAVEYLINHGYNPFAFISVLEKFNNSDRIHNKIQAAFLNSHPNPNNRIERIREQLKNYNEKDFLNENFNRRKERFEGFMNFDYKVYDTGNFRDAYQICKLKIYDFEESNEEYLNEINSLIKNEMENGYYPTGISIAYGKFYILYIKGKHILNDIVDAKILKITKHNKELGTEMENQNYVGMGLQMNLIKNGNNIEPEYTVLYLKSSNPIPFDLAKSETQMYNINEKHDYTKIMSDKINQDYVPMGVSFFSDHFFFIFNKMTAKKYSQAVLELMTLKEIETKIQAGINLGYFPAGIATDNEKILVLFIK